MRFHREQALVLGSRPTASSLDRSSERRPATPQQEPSVGSASEVTLSANSGPMRDQNFAYRGRYFDSVVRNR